MRETTYSPSELLLPDITSFGVRWTDSSLVYRIRHGDPGKGWEGDARLELYHHGPEDTWALVRYAFNGDSVLIRHWPRGETPDESVIDWLARHDVRRGYDAHAAIVANNERIDRARDSDAVGRLVEAGGRLGHAIRKDGLL